MAKKSVLDLFSGSGGFSDAFKEHEDWTVHRIDIKSSHDPDEVADILKKPLGSYKTSYDVILASPPCKSFSMGAIGHHWHKHDQRLRLPDSKTAYDGVMMVYRALQVIRWINPRYWFLENPRAGLRKVIGEPQWEQRREWWQRPREERGKPPGEVSWCQYWTDRDREVRGAPVMKPTDLWGRHPDQFEYKMCSKGDNCHESASRGSSSGTQGKPEHLRGSIPWGLSKEILRAVNEGF